jgi:hypothetical protein
MLSTTHQLHHWQHVVKNERETGRDAMSEVPEVPECAFKADNGISIQRSVAGWNKILEKIWPSHGN